MPLSEQLAAIVAATDGEALTLNTLLDRTDGRGLFLVLIILCLPFVALVSVPGMSTPLGIAIGVLAGRLAVGRPPHLPGRMGDRALSSRMRSIILKGGVRVLRVVEKAVRPRRSRWMSWPVTLKLNALVIMFMAFLLALPIPPVILFTNAFPSYAIILVAASMMEEDGVLIWLGYAAALGTTIYFIACGGLIFTLLRPWWHAVESWWQRL